MYFNTNQSAGFFGNQGKGEANHGGYQPSAQVGGGYSFFNKTENTNQHDDPPFFRNEQNSLKTSFANIREKIMTSDRKEKIDTKRKEIKQDLEFGSLVVTSRYYVC